MTIYQLTWDTVVNTVHTSVISCIAVRGGQHLGWVSLLPDMIVAFVGQDAGSSNISLDSY